MKAVIMAGGEGSRLRPITCDCPKPLTEIAGHPVIEYIFELLIRHSCDEAKVTLKYLAENITERYFSGKYKGLPLDFVMEERPLGTAGSVKNAADFEEDFAVISGDALCDIDLSAAFELHKRTNAAVTVVAARVGENAQIMPGVSVWPGKRVENGAVLSENLRYGTAHRELFDDDGISGDVGIDMSPEFAARLGAALAGLAPGGKIAVARGYDNCSAALSSAFLAGIVSAGVSAADIGPSPETAAAFAATCNMFSYVVYISGGEKTVIRIFAEGGLPLTREKERAVSGRIARSEFIRCKAAEYPFVSDMRAIKNLYTERLMSDFAE